MSKFNAGGRAFFWAETDQGIWEVDVLHVHKRTALVIGRCGPFSVDTSSLYGTAKECRDARSESMVRQAQSYRVHSESLEADAAYMRRRAPKVTFRSLPVDDGDFVRLSGRPEQFRVCSGNLDNGSGVCLAEPAGNPGAFAVKLTADGLGLDWFVGRTTVEVTP